MHQLFLSFDLAYTTHNDTYASGNLDLQFSTLVQYRAGQRARIFQHATHNYDTRRLSLVTKIRPLRISAQITNLYNIHVLLILIILNLLLQYKFTAV